MQIKVSIIIPVYNGERSIGRCLDSIVKQKTNYFFEVFVINGPSEDKTGEIIDEYSSRYEFIHKIDISIKSAAYGREQGINASNGEYLMFIDADDYYREDAIETMVSTIEKNNADIVACSYYYVHGNKIRKNFFSKNKTYDRKGMLKALMLDSYMHGFMWNKIYRSSLIKGQNYIVPQKHIIREDVLTNFQIFLKANKLVQISKPLYYYDKTYESTTSGKDITRVPWFITIFALERKLLEKYEPKMMKMYFSLQNRRKLLIFGDHLIVKKGYSREEYKELKKNSKIALKALKQKELPMENMPWEKFFIENKII